VKTLLFLATVALGLGIGSSAPQEPAPVLSIKTDLVTLPVTVADRHGGFISGLASKHFTVYDEGEPTPVAFFTNDDVPITIGLVVDSSTSMRVRRAQITAAATAFATMSHPLDEFFTVNFNESVWLGLPQPLAFTRDVAQLRAALAAAPAYGRTALFDAVDRAIDHLLLGTRDRKALIVVSDGGDNASTHTLEAVLQHARMTDAVIYAVILFERDDREARPRVLKTLARETGGRTFTPQQTADIAPAFGQIARELRSGYTIGVVPPEGAVGFRIVRVVANDGTHRQLVARTRVGYYAGPPRQTKQ
jgi:Ca-activated chloride channel family protein